MIAAEQQTTVMRQIKHVIVYDTLIRLLAQDRQAILPHALTFADAYLWMMERLQLRLEEDFRRERIALRNLGAQIVKKEEKAHTLEIMARHRGYFFRCWYMKDMLRADCERLLLLYLSGRKGGGMC